MWHNDDKAPRRICFDDAPNCLKSGQAFGQGKIEESEQDDAMTVAFVSENQISEVFVRRHDYAVFLFCKRKPVRVCLASRDLASKRQIVTERSQPIDQRSLERLHRCGGASEIPAVKHPS